VKKEKIQEVIEFYSAGPLGDPSTFERARLTFGTDQEKLRAKTAFLPTKAIFV